MKIKKQKFVLLIMIALILLSGCNGKSAGDFYKDGLDCMENQNYDDAHNYFTKAIEENSEKAEYYLADGAALTQSRKYEDAIAQYSKVILQIDNKIVRENNKRAYRGMGIAYYYIKNYDEAAKKFKTALDINELDTMNLDILNYFGDVKTALGDSTGALEVYNQILTIDGKNETALVKRANLHALLADYKGALADYDTLIKDDSKNINAMIGKYQCLLKTGDTSGAQSILDQASKFEAKTNEDKFGLAKIHFYQADNSQCEYELQEAVKNGFSEAYSYLGQLYFENNDYEKSVDYFLKYFNNNKQGTTPFLCNQIASAYMMLDKYDDALSWNQTGVAFNDQTETGRTLLYNEIIIKEKLGQYKEAEEKAKVYMEKYPDDEKMEKEYEFLQTRI